MESYLDSFAFQSIEILPTVNTNILASEYTGNHVTLFETQDEILLDFTPVNATGVLLHHLYGTGNAVWEGSAIYREFTFEEGFVGAQNPVPEPTSILLVGLGIAGLIRKKLKK